MTKGLYQALVQTLKKVFSGAIEFYSIANKFMILEYVLMPHYVIRYFSFEELFYQMK